MKQPRRERFIEHTQTRRKFEVAAIKKAKSSQESDAKAALWTALENSLNSQTSSLQANIAGTQEKSQNTLAERAKLFGETVADNLLQCDPKRKYLIYFTIMSKESLMALNKAYLFTQTALHFLQTNTT